MLKQYREGRRKGGRWRGELLKPKCRSGIIVPRGNPEMILMAHRCTIREGAREGNLSLILVEGNCKWLHVILSLISDQAT